MLEAAKTEFAHSATEIRSCMANPSELAMQAFKRLGRHLRAHPWMVFLLPFLSASTIEVYADKERAGCVRTRNSSAGGRVVIGSYVTNGWPATEVSLVLTSGQAEYYGVRAAGIRLGMQAWLNDAGASLPLRIWMDSSSALRTSARRSLCKLRSLECHSLCFQQRLRRRKFVIRKALGVKNPADLLTKHVESGKKLEQLVGMSDSKFRAGRPAAAPQLKREAPQPDVSPGGEGEDAMAGVVTKGLLPHLRSNENAELEFPVAEPQAERQGDDDIIPGQELGDSVSRLPRKPAGGRNTVRADVKVLGLRARVYRGPMSVKIVSHVSQTLRQGLLI